MQHEAIDFSKFCLEKARLDQAEEICGLINLTYRGEVGWTKETHIVQGNRTTRHEIESALNNPDAHFLVVNHPQQLAACIYVAKEQDNAYIGYFSVHPNLQGEGLGKHVLKQAESFALAHMGINKFVMFVVSQRAELIAFYERRGYIRTGIVEAYPVDLGIGVPIVDGLTIEYLEKIV
jgi:ribosomal protein S18 acetylase RimI-like enzyme